MGKHRISDFLNMGTATGLCTAVGVVLGGLPGNLVLWLGIGARTGVVSGAVAMLYKNRNKGGDPGSTQMADQTAATRPSPPDSEYRNQTNI